MNNNGGCVFSFEIHMEIGLPSEPGRLQILRIHTTPMRESNLMDTAVDLNGMLTLSSLHSSDCHDRVGCSDQEL